MTEPEVPDGVLVQSVVVHDDGERAGYRIFGDGRYETLPRGGGWREGERLDADRLARVRAALASEPLEELAGRYEGESGESGPNVLWVQVARPGGGVRTVSVVGDRRVPELERLSAALTDAFR